MVKSDRRNPRFQLPLRLQYTNMNKLHTVGVSETTSFWGIWMCLSLHHDLAKRSIARNPMHLEVVASAARNATERDVRAAFGVRAGPSVVRGVNLEIHKYQDHPSVPSGLPYTAWGSDT